jgi:hypothetical protein
MNEQLADTMKKANKLYAVIDKDAEERIPTIIVAVSNLEEYSFEVDAFCVVGSASRIHNKHLKLKKDILTLGYVYCALVRWDESVHAYFTGEDTMSNEKDSYYYCAYDFICDSIIAVQKIAKKLFKNNGATDKEWFGAYGYDEAFDNNYELTEIEVDAYDYKELNEDMA